MNQMQFTRATLASVMVLGLFMAMPTIVRGQSAHRNQQLVSFGDRLLLNRAALNGTEKLQVLLAVQIGKEASVIKHLQRLNGSVQFLDAPVGYIRVLVPTTRFADLIGDPLIASYQISTFSKGAWYRDGPPQSNAEMYRGYEVPEKPKAPKTPERKLPVITAEEARQIGYTADDGLGTKEFLTEHPTFDGRGVTIALIETGEHNFTHPALQTSLTLGGENTRKVIGLLNSIDPADPDESRVTMVDQLRALGTWAKFENRTYVLPHPGAFRIGMYSYPISGTIVQRFAVLWDETTNAVWVDTNGDASFQDERPLKDFSQQLDVNYLQLGSEGTRQPFVIELDAAGRVIHLYLSRGLHQTMTISTAVGSRFADGLVSGVAPQAQVLVVRWKGRQLRTHNYFEAYIKTARRNDVEIISDSSAFNGLPNSSNSFFTLMLDRIAETYHKIIFHSGGNGSGPIGNVEAAGNVVSVGGFISPASFTALYGPGTIPETTLESWSSWGPADDGSLKPDLLAPEHRLAATECVAGPVAEILTIPQNAPRFQLAPCYMVSGGTSTASPIAAGVAALLVSGAKQAHLAYDVERLKNALFTGSRFLAGWQSYQQGNGVLNVSAAWRALVNAKETSTISVSGSVNSVISEYLNGKLPGLYESEGWRLNQEGKRVIRLTRESGATEAKAYDVAWLGNDGTFACAAQIHLPLKQTIPFEINIKAALHGVHSAILILKEHETDVVTKRIPVTVVVPQEFTKENHFAVKDSGSVPLLGQADKYFYVPPGASSIRIDFEVLSGIAYVRMRSPNRLHSSYYPHLTSDTSQLLPGRHTYRIDDPEPGTWGIGIQNASPLWATQPQQVSTDQIRYSLELQMQRWNAVVEEQAGGLQLKATNRGAEVGRPVLRVAPGVRSNEVMTYLQNGNANRIEIVVPEKTSTLQIRADSNKGSSPLELYLYDCTSGECFSYDFRMPAQISHLITVRDPKPGKWVAMVNAAPMLLGKGGFTFESIITGSTATKPIPANGTVDLESLSAIQTPIRKEQILFMELIDEAAEEIEQTHPLLGESAKKLKTRPVALAFATYLLPGKKVESSSIQ